MAVYRRAVREFSSARRMGLVSLLVFVGCFAGARAGTAMVFPGVGTAMVFVPYAVLAAALMLTPARQWWLYIIASVAGNFWPHLRHEGWTSFVLLSELANILRAMVAAAGVRWFCSREKLFDSVQGAVAFLLFAVVLGPAAGAFAGAMTVLLYNPAADFRIVWQAWLLSNMLTGLTLLPLILSVVIRVRTGFRHSKRKWKGGRWRMLEMVVLSLGVLSVGLFSFTTSHSGGIVPASLYFPLPFLLWAAMRFGSDGMVLALTAVTTVTIAGALSGLGPFVNGTPADNLLQLQCFLISICVPLLLLAAIVQQQVQTAEALWESQAHYRAVVEDQADLICRMLPDGAYTFVNGAYCRYFGVTAEELFGRKIWEFIPPGEHEALRAHLAALSVEHPVGKIEHEVISASEGKHWQEWHNRGLFDEQGRIMGYQCIGRDVTDRRQSDQALRRALHEVSQLKERLEAENAYLHEELSAGEYLGDVICRSAIMRQTLAQMQQVAQTDTTVLILGETGAGKEVIAREIHRNSRRKNRAFVRLNCAALPPQLIESELFGHERGAFTGAVARRQGRFEIANGATLFLDEMGELPLEIQAKLLRVLQEGECERLGSSETMKVDVRLITATNRNLSECVQKGTFRADLYYRLNVFPITVPPLRSRKEDIVPLATAFLSAISQKLKKQFAPISNANAQILLGHHWPGNVRELANVIERAAISSDGENLRLPDLSAEPHKDVVIENIGEGNDTHDKKGIAHTHAVAVQPMSIQEIERNHILATLDLTHGRIEGPLGAAVMLGINASTLRFKMKKLGIVRAKGNNVDGSGRPPQ